MAIEKLEAAFMERTKLARGPIQPIKNLQVTWRGIFEPWLSKSGCWTLVEFNSTKVMSREVAELRVSDRNFRSFIW